VLASLWGERSLVFNTCVPHREHLLKFRWVGHLNQVVCVDGHMLFTLLLGVYSWVTRLVIEGLQVDLGPIS